MIISRFIPLFPGECEIVTVPVLGKESPLSHIGCGEGARPSDVAAICESSLPLAQRGFSEPALCGRLTAQRIDMSTRGPYLPNMRSNFVTLHPYFKVHLFYGFSINGDEVFCREGYESAEGVLAHLENVGALLAEALKISELIRVEMHGPAEELDKLKEPLAHLNPEWFVIERQRW
jgi:hypothetical protein